MLCRVRSLLPWLWSAGRLGRVLHGCRRGQCLMVLTGREGGRDLVIDGVLLSVDAVGVHLQQHGDVVTEPPGDLSRVDTVVQPGVGRGV